jgi:hypothetical protein
MLGQPPSLSGTTATIHPRRQDSPSDTDAEIRAIYTIAKDDQTQVHVKPHPNDLIRDEMLFDEEEEKQQSLAKKMKNEMVVRLMPGMSTLGPIDRLLMCIPAHSPYPTCSERICRQGHERVPEFEELHRRLE